MSGAWVLRVWNGGYNNNNDIKATKINKNYFIAKVNGI